jgi:hypothetical protein
MDNNGNDERIVEEIIARGANAFASYTYEDIILNTIGEGGIAADDFANNEEDIAADSKNNDDLEDANAEDSNEYTYHALSSLVLIRQPHFLYTLINLCRFMENYC